MTDISTKAVDRVRKYTEYPYTEPETIILDSELVRLSAGDLMELLKERDELEAENAALRGRVKPLEWEKADESAWLAHGLEVAEYHISTNDGGESWDFSEHYDPEEGPDFSGTLEEAKAHVEELHKSKVMRALTPNDADAIAEARIKNLEEENAALRGAMKTLRNDMLERAEIGLDVAKGEEYRIVNAGNGAWMAFCAALGEE